MPGFPNPSLTFDSVHAVADDFNDGVIGFPWQTQFLPNLTPPLTIEEVGGVLRFDTGDVPGLQAEQAVVALPTFNIPHFGSYSAEAQIRFAEGTAGVYQFLLAIGYIGVEAGHFISIAEFTFEIGQPPVGARIGLSADGQTDVFAGDLGASLVGANLTLTISYDFLTQTLVGQVDGLPGDTPTRNFSLTNIPPLENPQLILATFAGDPGHDVVSRSIVEIDAVQSSFTVPRYFLINSPLKYESVNYSVVGPGIFEPGMAFDMGTGPFSFFPVTGTGALVVADGFSNFNVVLVEDTNSGAHFSFVTPRSAADLLSILGPSMVADLFIPDAYVAQGVGLDYVADFIPEPTPDTVILSGPFGLTNDDSATFAFDASPSVTSATFECSLNGGLFRLRFAADVNRLAAWSAPVFGPGRQ